MLKNFKKIGPGTQNDNKRVQENVQQVLEPIINKVILDGILHEKVQLIAGSTINLEHKLGRKLKGWIITRQRGASMIWDDQDFNTNTQKTLNLNCASDVCIDIWVF
jgi:hypothetical protein